MGRVHWLVAGFVALGLLWVSAPSGGQKKDKGPSLEETTKFICDKMKANARFDHSFPVKDEHGKVQDTRRHTIRVTECAFDPATSRLSWAAEEAWSNTSSPDDRGGEGGKTRTQVALCRYAGPLRSVTELSMEDVEVCSCSKQKPREMKVFLIDLTSSTESFERKLKDGNDPWEEKRTAFVRIYWEDQVMVQRVLKALEHAVKLTGGKVAKPKPAPKEPF